MAVNDTTLLLGMGLLFVYLVLYRRNHFLGNIGYFGLGLGSLMYSPTDTARVVSLIILGGAFANLIYDLAFTKK